MRPLYGSRRMAVFLRGRGHCVNRKRVQRVKWETGSGRRGWQQASRIRSTWSYALKSHTYRRGTEHIETMSRRASRFSPAHTSLSSRKPRRFTS